MRVNTEDRTCKLPDPTTTEAAEEYIGGVVRVIYAEEYAQRVAVKKAEEARVIVQVRTKFSHFRNANANANANVCVYSVKSTEWLMLQQVRSFSSCCSLQSLSIARTVDM